MNILRNLLGSKKPARSFSSGKMSYANFLVEQKVNMSTAQCHICNSSFVAPEHFKTLIPMVATGGSGDDISFRAQSMDEWVVDVGGLCIECLRLMCHRHVVFIADSIGADPEMRKIYATLQHFGNVEGFRPACADCGKELVPVGTPGMLTILNSPEGKRLLEDPANRQQLRQQFKQLLGM